MIYLLLMRPRQLRPKVRIEKHIYVETPVSNAMDDLNYWIFLTFIFALFISKKANRSEKEIEILKEEVGRLNVENKWLAEELRRIFPRKREFEG